MQLILEYISKVHYSWQDHNKYEDKREYLFTFIYKINLTHRIHAWNKCLLIYTSSCVVCIKQSLYLILFFYSKHKMLNSTLNFQMQDLLQILWDCTSLHIRSEYWRGKTSSDAMPQSAVQSYSAALLQKKGSRQDFCHRRRHRNTQLTDKLKVIRSNTGNVRKCQTKILHRI